MRQRNSKGQLISKCPFDVFKSSKKKQQFFSGKNVVFLENLKTPKDHFKISWHLEFTKSVYENSPSENFHSNSPILKKSVQENSPVKTPVCKNWRAKNIFWLFSYVVLWPYLLTTKLRCLQKNNIGHTIVHSACCIVVVV